MANVEEGSVRRAPRTSKRKKKNQIPIGIVIFIIIVAIGIWLSFSGDDLALYWMIGIAFGFVLQRSRFCFTASMRDPYLTGSTSVTRAVLIAFAITSIAFTAIKYGYFVNGLPIPRAELCCAGERRNRRGRIYVRDRAWLLQVDVHRER